MQREITFFFLDSGERQAGEPLARVAEERGYGVSFSEDPQEPADVGVYCSHNPDPSNARFSLVMLHDLGQEDWPTVPSYEPNLWSLSPWQAFDLGILPGPAWSECWHSVSWHPNTRPRLGVFELGWPKADRAFRDTAAFTREVEQLRTTLGLKARQSVVYAPSFENDTKQDDFVRSLLDLPVNLLIKQAHWPEENARIADMCARHQALGDNVYIVDPKVNIVHCLALADVLVTDESNCLVEALLFEVPGVAVTDWMSPAVAGLPQRPVRPPPTSIRTVRSELRRTVSEALRDRERLRPELREKRRRFVSHFGQSSPLVMDLLDAALIGAPLPAQPLMPQPLDPGRYSTFGVDPHAEAAGRPREDEDLPAPVIEDFGPRPIGAGVPFNVQPSGKSALWFRTRHATYRTVVLFDGRELRSAVSPDGLTVSAIVPGDLFATPGKRAIWLLDKLGGKKSQVVTLQVE